MVDRVKSASSKIRCYAYSTIKAPDKGEVGGSSPPRPTIQITSKYAAILTFPLLGNSSQKTNLPTICQLFGQIEPTALRALQGGAAAEMRLFCEIDSAP